MPLSATGRPKISIWVWGMLPILLGAWLRLRHIGEPEAFVDEGANILSALDLRVRTGFDPLAQGRPGLSWLFKPAGWFPEYTLAFARSMSAGAGIVTMIALGWILHWLAGRTSALFGMLLWAVMPLAVFHERLALQDPFITALLAGSVALITQGSAKPSGRFAYAWFLIAGILFGCACLQKVSAVLALPWLMIVYLAVRHQAAQPLFDRRMLQIVLGAALPFVSLGSHIFLLGTQLDHYEAITLTRHADFFSAFADRLEIWCSYYANYGRWPLLLVAMSAAILTCLEKNRVSGACALGWVLAFVITGIFYNNIFARYIVSDQLPLVLFLAVAMSRVLQMEWVPKAAVLTVLLICTAAWGRTSWQIGSDPLRAAIPQKEITQYHTGPWSGSGLGSVKQFLKDYSDRHHVTCVVLTYRFLRPGAYGLMLAEIGDPRLVVVPYIVYWPKDLESAKPDLRRMSHGQRLAFFILYEEGLYPHYPWIDLPGAPARLVHHVQRDGQDAFNLYQFEP